MFKETLSLLKSRNKALTKAEDKVEELTKQNKTLQRKVEDRNLIIADMEKESSAVYEENKDLRFENDEQKDLINEILKLVSSNKYNSEKIIISKIKELITDYQSRN